MTTTPLFQEIAESIRQAIISGALRPGDVMLIKGSRALAMERLVAALATGATCAA